MTSNSPTAQEDAERLNPLAEHLDALGYHTFGMADVDGAEGAMYVASDVHQEIRSIILARATPASRAAVEAAAVTFRADLKRALDARRVAFREAMNETVVTAARAEYAAAEREHAAIVESALRAVGASYRGRRSYNDPAFRAAFESCADRAALEASKRRLHAASLAFYEAENAAHRAADKIHRAAVREAEARRSAAIKIALGERDARDLLAAERAAAEANDTYKRARAVKDDDWAPHEATRRDREVAKLEGATAAAAARAMQAYFRVRARACRCPRPLAVRVRHVMRRRTVRRRSGRRLAARAGSGPGDPSAPEPDAQPRALPRLPIEVRS